MTDIGDKLEKHGIFFEMIAIATGSKHAYGFKGRAWQCPQCGWQTEEWWDGAAYASPECAEQEHDQKEAAIYHAERCKG